MDHDDDARGFFLMHGLKDLIVEESVDQACFQELLIPFEQKDLLVLEG